jgi:hypothetical protein
MVRKKRNILDQDKRSQILALLSNGSSRRTAALIVGCAPSTITRTAIRDPEFAQQLALAERNIEVSALRTIRNAARQERYWRAAAWILERLNPDEFAPRPSKSFSPAEVGRVLSHVALLLMDKCPAHDANLAIEYLDQMILTLADEFSSTPPNVPPLAPTTLHDFHENQDPTP